MGHVISKDGVMVDLAKIEAVSNWGLTEERWRDQKFFRVSRILQEVCQGFLEDCLTSNSTYPKGEEV